MKKLLIIDGNNLLSQKYYGLLPNSIKKAKTEEEKKKYYNEIMQTADGTYTNAVYGMLRYILKLIRYQNPEYIAVVFDKAKATFRKEMYKEYKAGRKATPEPLKKQFALMEEILKEIGVPVFSMEGYEADDLAGSLIEKFKTEISCTVISKDLDYMQLLDQNNNVRVWYPETDQRNVDSFHKLHYGTKRENLPDKIKEYTEKIICKQYSIPSAKAIVDMKAIEGDCSDNIPGVNGITKKQSRAILKKYGSLDGFYLAVDQDIEAVNTFAMKKLGNDTLVKKLISAKEQVCFSKELVTICRDIPLDVELEDLRCKVNVEKFLGIKEKYEFHSLHLN